METTDEAKKDVRIETVSTSDAPVAQGPCVQVAALPRGARVKIDAIAVA